MIDTWLFAALVLGVLSFCVVLRGVPAKSRDDRLVAGSVAVILASMAALTLGIGLGMFIIIDAAILVSICCFGALIWQAKNPGADRS